MSGRRSVHSPQIVCNPHQFASTFVRAERPNDRLKNDSTRFVVKEESTRGKRETEKREEKGKSTRLYLRRRPLKAVGFNAIRRNIPDCCSPPRTAICLGSLVHALAALKNSFSPRARSPTETLNENPLLTCFPYAVHWPTSRIASLLAFGSCRRNGSYILTKFVSFRGGMRNRSSQFNWKVGGYLPFFDYARNFTTYPIGNARNTRERGASKLSTFDFTRVLRRMIYTDSSIVTNTCVLYDMANVDLRGLHFPSLCRTVFLKISMYRDAWRDWQVN